MVAQYTTATLLSDIKQEGMIPTSQTTYTNAKILALATREMRSHLVPYLSQTREGFFVWPGEISLQSGVLKYDIPDRAVAASFDDLLLKASASGNVRSIPRITPHDRERYEGSSTSYFGTNAFYLENNKIVLVNDASGSGYDTLLVPYQIRLGELVETSDAAKITAINTGTNTVTLSSLPSDFASSANYDFIKGTGGHEYRAIDQTCTALDSGAVTMTFSGGLPSDLAVNDWVGASGETPLPQIPADLTPILVYRTLIKILKSIGDFDGAKAAQEELMALETSILKVITPRVKGETKFIVSGQRRRFGGFY